MRQWGQVARCADRALGWHHRDQILSSRASSISTVAGRTPDAPWPRLASLRAIISRTIGAGVAAHTCRVRQHDVALQCLEVAVAIRTLASLPNPVFMP